MAQAHTNKFENQTPGEEIANSITHGMGALLSVAATVLVTVFAVLDGSVLKITAGAVYGSTLILLYTASTLYHATVSPRLKHLFHIFDHALIFLLIAGTYTPITLVALGGAWGWSIFGIIWGLAILGIFSTAMFFHKARYFNVVLYVAMGWLIVISGNRVLQALTLLQLIWLAAGGVFYTAGVYFYKKKSLRFHHMVWHLFVLAGSICHFFLVLSL